MTSRVTAPILNPARPWHRPDRPSAGARIVAPLFPAFQHKLALSDMAFDKPMHPLQVRG